MDKYDIASELRSLASKIEGGIDMPDETPGTENQVVKSLSRPAFFGVMIKHQIHDGRSKEVEEGGALAVNENIRFNCTPTLMDGSKGKGDDPRINGNPKFFKQDDSNNGKSPIVEYAWGVGGTEFSNSGNDPFHLNSYEDNAGFTPNLKLTRPIGSGRHKVWIHAFIRPQYNGGVGVKSEPYEFYAD